MTDTITNRFSVRTTPPAIGQKVRAYSIPGFSEYEGTVVTIANVDVFAATAEFPSRQKPDDTIRLSFQHYEEVLERHEDATITPTVADVSEDRLGRSEIAVPHDATPDDLRAIITNVSNDLAEAKMVAESRRERVETLQRTCDSLSNDIDTIGHALMSEAEGRGWCSEYDEFVEGVNSRLSASLLPEREQEYEIEVEITGTLRTTAYVMVSARSEEDARAKVSDDPDEYIDDADDRLTAAARSTSFDDIEIEAS